MRQLQVGLDEVVEHLDVEVDAFLGQGGFDELEDLGVGHRGGADHQVFGGLHRKAVGGDECGEGSKGLFHGSDPEGIEVSVG
ncbi:hypothetical protein D3C76_1712170 [compost metagenome]